MQLNTIDFEVHDDIASIVLNRPAVLNCADEVLVRDLHAVLDEIEDDGALRLVIVRGAGRAFCSGIDLTALSEGHIGADFFRGWELALRRLELLDQPVIAAIHSYCIGGGLQLALACDLRLAREDARFGVTAAKEGIIPGMGMWRLARHSGLGRTKRLTLTAEVIDAPTAYDWGLVDRVVDADSFETSLSQLTERVLSLGPTAVRLNKKLIAMAHDTPFAEFVETFCEYQQQATGSDEHRRAMAERRAQRASRTARLPPEA